MRRTVRADIERTGRLVRYIKVVVDDEPEPSDATRFPIGWDVDYAFVWGDRWARAKARRLIRKHERRIEREKSATRLVGRTF